MGGSKIRDHFRAKWLTFILAFTDIDEDGFVKPDELYKYFIIEEASSESVVSVLGDGAMNFYFTNRKAEKRVGTYRQTLKVTSKASGLSKYTDIYVEYLGEAQN